MGLFAQQASTIRFAHIRDGLSNTLMVGETLPGHSNYNGAYNPNFCIASTHIPLNVMERDRDNWILPPPLKMNPYWKSSGFKSLHPGGVQFAMADGSVHFVFESIDYSLINRLGTRAGNDSAMLP